MNLFRSPWVVVLLLVVQLLGSMNVQADFTDPGNWTTFDIQANGIGAVNRGYLGTIFDGEYVYMIGSLSGTPHGEWTRYHIAEDFSDPASWEAYDAGANGVGTDPDGFRGGVFDGRYIYAAPFGNESNSRTGEIIRYDTLGDFQVAGSWQTFDTQAQNANARGYQNAVYDGRYVYFVGWLHTGYSSLVSRYDTQDPDGFNDPGSWTYYEHGLGLGYSDAVFDGRYIYFTPYDIGSGNGVFARYDTQGGFTNPASWTGYDPDLLIGNDLEGFRGGAFDGTYIYFAPEQNSGTTHGQVLRLDTTSTFTDINSWTIFDASSVGPNTDGGYHGVVFDGVYMHFIPSLPGAHGEVLRYNTHGNFTNPASWDSYDPLGATERTYFTASWDGSYIYFSPFTGTAGAASGEVLRYYAEESKELRGRAYLSTSTTSATDVQYELLVTPIIPFDDQSQIVLTFPQEYDAEFDALLSGDVAVEATNLASTTIGFNDTQNQMTITLTTTNGGENEIVTPVRITIGDGAPGGLTDFTNPSVPGGYAIGVDAITMDGNRYYQDHALAYIQNNVDVEAILVEALVMTLNATGINFTVDPAVNDGRILTESTVLSVATNALSGYTIQAMLNDGNNNAQLADGNGNVIPSDNGAGDNYFSYAARNDGTGVQTGAEHDFAGSSSVLFDDNNQQIGHGTTTNNQQHTINYDLNVNFLKPAGAYIGTVYYTIVANF